MSHLDFVQVKSRNVYYKLCRANWRLKLRVRKVIYSLVAERIVLYVASI